jgi:hypothetical protein
MKIDRQKLTDNGVIFPRKVDGDNRTCMKCNEEADGLRIEFKKLNTEFYFCLKCIVQAVLEDEPS